MPGVDDIAVSTIRFRGDHRRLHDADGLDRRQHQCIRLRRRIRLAHPVRVFLQRARVNLHDLHGIYPFGRFRTGALPALLVFIFSRRHLPDRGAAGLPQLRPSIPAGKGKRGFQPCAGQSAGMAQAAVERKRRQEDRSATRSCLLLSSFSNLISQFGPTARRPENAGGGYSDDGTRFAVQGGTNHRRACASKSVSCSPVRQRQFRG